MTTAWIFESLFELDYMLARAWDLLRLTGLLLLLGGPPAFLWWKRTGNLRKAVAVGAVSAMVGWIIVAFLYINLVLCPEGAGCA